MISFLKRFFGGGKELDSDALKALGATIIDVRTATEYKSGHAKGSINIPLDQPQKNISRLKKDKPIVVCCATGMRSGSAKNLLQKNGFTQVYNGGSWQNFR